MTAIQPIRDVKNQLNLLVRLTEIGRVEMWRGSSRFGLSVVRPFRLAVPK